MSGELVPASNALTARWVKEVCDGTTTVLSGAGVWPLLAFLAAASREPGRAELQRAIGVDAAGADRHARVALGMLDSSTAATGAFGVWTHAGLPVEPWWHKIVPARARGELTGDTADDQARLDEWVRQNTGDRLSRLPIGVGPDTALVLATALTVDTRWKEPFEDVPLTPEEGPWAGRAERLAGLTHNTTDTNRLTLAEETPAGPVTLLTVHGEDDVDVILCLGQPDRRPGDVLAAAMAATDGQIRLRRGERLLQRALAEKTPGLRVDKALAFDPRPTLTATTVRFDIAAEHDLLAHAGVFGLETVSTQDRRGHLPGISRTPLAVGQAAQDVNATFSAEGFRAAAVTAIGAVPAGAPMAEAQVLNVTFDRPFGFLTWHRPTGLILLAGWVAEPENWTEPDPEPELTR
ncbi:serpin family protein [Actinomadura sp. 3N508]|uniref:serpin family protein n=1 Tax=Actinomadura sp. 3N508 TaxID=3375153 RepID=UPI0037899D30